MHRPNAPSSVWQKFGLQLQPFGAQASQTMHSLLPSRLITLIAFGSALICAGALAVDPPPDGGYPNENTAEGQDALLNLTTGYDNTAVGFVALSSTTSGFANTAIGFGALAANTTGVSNTATGWSALVTNTTGDSNTATGLDALLENTTGNRNTANGNLSLGFNTTGNSNTAIGVNALKNNTIGSNNNALGPSAGASQTTGSNNIYVSAVGASGESNVMRLGKFGVQTKTFMAGVSGSVVPEGVPVIVDSLGHMGTTTSSARYKEKIQPMAKSSELILSLKPVTFRYKKELDPKAIPQFGLVAEEVAKVDSDLVAKDGDSRPYAVRYDAINAMLLNEFLKEHRTVESLEQAVAEQRREIESLKAALNPQMAARQNPRTPK